MSKEVRFFLTYALFTFSKLTIPLFINQESISNLL